MNQQEQMEAQIPKEIKRQLRLAQINELKEIIGDLFTILCEVEFNGPNDANPICPSCYGWQSHEENCKLDAVLKKAGRVL
jgi:hypothetical protein